MDIEPVDLREGSSTNETNPIELTLPEKQKDTASDHKIVDFLKHKENVVSEVITYVYDMQAWPIRIILNPENKPLIAEKEGTRMTFNGLTSAVVSLYELPLPLKAHLTALFNQEIGHTPLIFKITNDADDSSHFELLAQLKPLQNGTSSPVASPAAIELIKKTSITLPTMQKKEVREFTPASDEDILQFLNQKSFCKQVMDYNYDGKLYRLLFIRNPEKQLLACDQSHEIFRQSFIVSSWPNHAPAALRNHLEKLASTFDPTKDFLFHLEHRREASFHQTLLNLAPALVNKNGDLNEVFDEQIKKGFQSSELFNKVFFYQIGNELYKVRIIHNPEKRRLIAQQDLREEEYFGRVPRSWSDRYGIVIDKTAPQELVDHLKSLVPASTYDYYLSFKVINHPDKLNFFTATKDIYQSNLSYCDWLSTLKRA